MMTGRSAPSGIGALVISDRPLSISTRDLSPHSVLDPKPTMARDPAKLTERQARFVAEYLVDFNGTRAAKSAGYANASAHVAACELLKLPKIAAQISKVRDKVTGKAELSAVTTLEELRRILVFDPARIVDENGALLPLNRMAPDVRACISSIEIDEAWVGEGEERKLVGRTGKVRFWSKPAALSAAMKHFDLLQAAGLSKTNRTAEEEKTVEAAKAELKKRFDEKQGLWHGPKLVPIKANGGGQPH